MTKSRFLSIALVCVIIFGSLSQMTYALYTTTNPWPVWRYDAQHNAYTTSTAPTSNQTVWATSSSPSYYPEGTAPIVVGGMVIFQGSGAVYALDETTGVQLWKTGFAISGSLYYSNPSYSDGKVFITTSSGYVYCINATNGKKTWENQVTSTGSIYSSPTVANGEVYVTTTDTSTYNVFGLNISTGSKGIGIIKQEEPSILHQQFLGTWFISDVTTTTYML